MSKCVRATLLRFRGNYTTTYETEFADGCVTAKRTSTTYEAAKVVYLSPQAATCPEHRRG